MRRVAEVPLEYLAAGILALGLGIGIYALRHSTASSTLTTAAAPAVHPLSHPSVPIAPQDNPFGVALIKRSEKAYARIPGVSLAGRVGAVSLHFVMVLHDGRVVAESFTGHQDTQTTQLVAPHGAVTFVRAPGSGCWKGLPASAPQALSDVSHRFPYFDPQAQILVPQQVASGWAVNAAEKGQLEAFVLGARSYLVRTAVAVKAGVRLTMPVQNLSQAPQLPLPEPRCS
ncbi:MAG: hypothetical protein JO244_00450 [Solirubrobacterales bacterium]|nr:hypothetical protein [Solirubrobacterales bacterium]